jgi:hypothetical protein
MTGDNGEVDAHTVRVILVDLLTETPSYLTSDGRTHRTTHRTAQRMARAMLAGEPITIVTFELDREET